MNKAQRKKDVSSLSGEHLEPRSTKEEDNTLGNMSGVVDNHAEDNQMKETLNEEIELARQSGYNEACYIKDKKFREFIQDLKEELYAEFQEDTDRAFRAFMCVKKRAGEELILNKTEKNFNKNKDVKAEYNHSPQRKGISSADEEEDKGSIPLPEDTSQDICECGRTRATHFLDGHEPTYCYKEGDKKFKKKDELIEFKKQLEKRRMLPEKKGLKVIDGTPTAISNYLIKREKEDER